MARDGQQQQPHDTTSSSSSSSTVKTGNKPPAVGKQQSTSVPQDLSPSQASSQPSVSIAAGQKQQPHGLVKDTTSARAAPQTGPAPSLSLASRGPPSAVSKASLAQRPRPASGGVRNERHARPRMNEAESQPRAVASVTSATGQQQAQDAGGRRQERDMSGLKPGQGAKSTLSVPMVARGGHVARSQQPPPKREPEQRRKQPSSKKAQREQPQRASSDSGSSFSVASSGSATPPAAAGKSLLSATSSVVSSSQSHNLTSSSSAPFNKSPFRQKQLYNSTKSSNYFNNKTNTSDQLKKQTSTKTTPNTIMANQAVIDKLEAGFAKLQAATPEQCHSLLKKYLTREVLDKNKTKQTAMGATLLDVAQSGFENLDSGVGIYAPDAESYTLFADLFNPIIEDYHGGFKATDKHPQSDFGDINTLVNLDPNNEFVISTRVRCGRSLKGYPFNPCLTEAQYKEMEQKVSSTLKEMSGDLAGTYYPLTGMTKETQQQLIDDHFLFKEGDRFLQAANACRYWPTGRGIYHNAEKTFLVWVNEEDHLRIISMQKGGDLKTIYDRLIRGAKSIESKVPFSRDDRLGFLTFCPTNLGTTIRASVHIKLPKLAADRKKLEQVASQYNLQVRGTSGEHTESVGGVYDISNKRRLGLTEYQAVREMQDGILELIKLEKSL